MRRFAIIVGCIAFVAFLWLFHPLDARAATITVTTASDDATPGNGIVSLREAINAINNGSTSDTDITAQNPTAINPFGTNDTIIFDASVFPAGVPETIILSDDPNTGGPLFLDENMTIDGTGHQVLVDGAGEMPIFLIGVNLFTEPTVRINGLTMQNGSGGEGGGAIVNFGILTVTNCVFTNNNGFIEAGAIDNFAALIVVNCTFMNNTANQGGAIFHGPTLPDSGPMIVIGSTFTGNSAAPDVTRVPHPRNLPQRNLPRRSNPVRNDGFGEAGGGIFLCSCATASITNSTFTGNTSTDVGGAILDEGELTLTNVTISGNSAMNNGGGVYVDAEAEAVLVATNTLIAGNTLTGGGAGPDVNGAFNPGSANNLLRIGDGSTGLTNGTNGNIVSTSDGPINPLLGTLGNYGGKTRTIPLLPGSPAIDAGTLIGSAPSFSIVPAADQRGKPRFGAVPDIGAFESQGFSVTTSGTPQSTPINTRFASPLAVTVTPNNPGEPMQGGVVGFTVTSAGNGATATLSGGKQILDASGKTSVTATANGIAGGPYTAIVSGAGVSSATFNLTNTPPAIPVLVRIVVSYNGLTRPSLRVGQVAPFTATAVYDDNSMADVTKQVIWGGDNDPIAKVDPSGNVSGQSPGTLLVKATLGTISGLATTTVIAPTPVNIQPNPVPRGTSGGATGGAPAKSATGSNSPSPGPPSR
jgi:hypothetical protein